jgi:glycosyltransferase involved in cell wall biosynthesis
VPRRVLQVLGQSAGGVGRHVAEIVRALDGNELSIDVAAPAGLRVEMPKPVIPVAIPSGAVRGHARAVLSLIRLQRTRGFDLIHAHGLRASLDATIAARLCRVPALVTLHNLVEGEIVGGMRAAIYARAEPLAVRLSAHTFVPSRDMADRLAASVPRSARKIEVLHAGAGPPPTVDRPAVDVRRELGLEDEQLIVTVARLHKQKALTVLLGALQRLDDSVVLAVLGEGPLEGELKEDARTRGVDKRVMWLGFQPNVADYVAAADVFCISSIWEAVPLAAQEAVQLGTAVVATDVGGLGELITDGRSGRLVPKNDDEALAHALRETLASDELRARYAATALEEFRARFSRDAIVARLRQVYSGDL